MTAWQQRLGAAQQLDGDQRRLGLRLAGGVPQPCDRLLIPPLGSEHQMIRHLQPVRARGHQRDRGLTVQKAAGRRRHVPVDRVVHELVPEHHPVAGPVQKLGVERAAELPGDLGRRPAGDSGAVANRHGIAEARRDLQQLQRRPRPVPPAAGPPGT